jgi:hypothetical protein
MYLTSIPKFGLAPVGKVSDIGTTAAPGSGNGDDSVPTTVVETFPVQLGGDGPSGGLLETEFLAECETGSSSLRNIPVGLAARPIGRKRKAAMNESESGSGRILASDVDSVGKAIEKNGKSRERAANIALRYRLVEKAGFNQAEKQADYRKHLADAERSAQVEGSDVLDRDNSAHTRSASEVVRRISLVMLLEVTTEEIPSRSIKRSSFSWPM